MARDDVDELDGGGESEGHGGGEAIDRSRGGLERV